MSEATQTNGRRATQRGRSLAGPRIVAVLILALSAWILYGAVQIPEPNGFSPFGPRTFPLLVGTGLFVFGMIFLVSVTVRPDEELAQKTFDEERATSWVVVGMVAVSLLVYALLLEPVGYVISTGIFFAVMARILGSDRAVRDLLIGICIALATYLGFVEVLGVQLPAGLLDSLL